MRNVEDLQQSLFDKNLEISLAAIMKALYSEVGGDS